MSVGEFLIDNIFSSDHDESVLKTNLDVLIKDVVEREDYSFHNGILGVGWLLEYLEQNDYLYFGDLDELLIDIDDNIYKLSSVALSDQNESVIRYLEYLSYFQLRRTNKRKTNNFYRNFVHKECLALIINRLIYLYDACKKINSIEGNDLPLTLLKISSLTNTGLEEYRMEEFFFYWMEYFCEYYSNKQKDLDARHSENVLFLLITAIQYDNPYWVGLFSQILYDNLELLDMNRCGFVIPSLINSDPSIKMDVGSVNPLCMEILMIFVVNIKNLKIK
ncbi:hypothetical protein [Sphingobacterium deserti]|uniref:Uncharacterized protein n=1 Tax=Sphingobacterium deserti TaxID=1229276 RepID=A0A0B8TB66_9SPHI|nr:hypothetical protein [Sphingobacterium deserti]KGE16124.1 hypothetical protein DI53_0239 [Sphingobacterium deserti]